MSSERDIGLLQYAYAAYNSRDLPGLLTTVAEDVDWPDGAGGRLVGKAALEAFWSAQWAYRHTHDKPVAFRRCADGTITVEVDQKTRIRDHPKIVTNNFTHIFQVNGGLIERLEIRSRP